MSQDQSAGANAAASPPAAPADDGGGTLSVGGILTVASILALFVVFAFGISSLQFCINSMDRRRRRVVAEAEESSSPSARRRRTRGVDPELLRSLPVTVYRAAASKTKEPDATVECAVCLAELEDGEEARFLPRCGHGFHADCVDTWLASHTTCPLCRLTVAKPDTMLPAMAPIPHELPNYYASSANLLPASVLLGGASSDHQQGAAVNAAAARSTTDALVIEIPPEPTACDAAKSPPGSARLRAIRRLWSFGGMRQGAAAGPSSSCSCGRDGEVGADVEQDTSVVTVGFAVAEAQLPSEAASAVAARGAAA